MGESCKGLLCGVRDLSSGLPRVLLVIRIAFFAHWFGSELAERSRFEQITPAAGWQRRRQLQQVDTEGRDVAAHGALKQTLALRHSADLDDPASAYLEARRHRR
jgi:hypothetical protein